MTTSSYQKEIRYDLTTRDFELLLNGETVGWARSYADGERRLDELVYALLTTFCPVCQATPCQCPDPELAAANAEIAEVVAAQRGAYEPDAEERAEVAAWLDELEVEAVEEAPAATPATLYAVAPRDGYTLPPAALVAEALAELRRGAEGAAARALDKAAYQVAEGAYAAARVTADGALLVPSRSTGGTVYRVEEGGCSCEARGVCWHGALFDGVLLARDVVAAQLDDEAEYRRMTALTLVA
jgi:CBS domain-containing protein